MYTYYSEPNLDTGIKSKLVIIKHNKQDTNLVLYVYKQVQKKEDITVEGYVDFRKWKSTASS